MLRLTDLAGSYWRLFGVLRVWSSSKKVWSSNYHNQWWYLIWGHESPYCSSSLIVLELRAEENWIISSSISASRNERIPSIEKSCLRAIGFQSRMCWPSKNLSPNPNTSSHLQGLLWEMTPQLLLEYPFQCLVTSNLWSWRKNSDMNMMKIIWKKEWKISWQITLSRNRDR